jgi:hypothetical protein
MVFNATFNNISVISWRSVLLMEETGVPEENYRPAASHRQTLSHNVVLSTPHLSEILLKVALNTITLLLTSLVLYTFPSVLNFMSLRYQRKLHFN